MSNFISSPQKVLARNRTCGKVWISSHVAALDINHPHSWKIMEVRTFFDPSRADVITWVFTRF